MKAQNVYTWPAAEFDGNTKVNVLHSTAAGAAYTLSQSNGETLTLFHVKQQCNALSTGACVITNSAGTRLYVHEMVSSVTSTLVDDQNWAVGIRVATEGGDTLTFTPGTTNARIHIQAMKTATNVL